MAYVSTSEPAMLLRLGRDAVSLAPARARHSGEPEAVPAVFEVVRERAGLDALEPEWNDLFRRAGRSAQLFQTFNWNWHWANHYVATQGRRGGPSLAIVTVRREGRLVMLWPLVLERTAGLRVLRWMGEPVSQYGDVLAEDGPGGLLLMHQAWRFVTTRLGADVICLRKVRADAAIAPLLGELGMQQTAAEEAPYLDLASAPDFAGYEQRYTAKARKNRRRLARRLAEQGPHSLERYTGGAEARAAAPQAIALKREWIKHTGRVSRALADPRFAAFFADVAEGRVRPAGCGVTVLQSNGAPAGIAVDITCGDRRAAHIIVHDPRLESFSPGTLLLEAWIKGACADGIATFDLLAPAYGYKLDWADGSVAVGDFSLGLTLAGRAYVHLYLGLARRTAKAAAEALPHLLGRLRALVRRATLVGWVKRSADPTPISGE
jgi:CelD/BcsL family acetyltransferase involved in cellulose biosynthesis